MKGIAKAVLFFMIIFVLIFFIVRQFELGEIENSVPQNPYKNCLLEKKIGGWRSFLFSHCDIGNFNEFVFKDKEPVTSLLLVKIIESRLKKEYFDFMHNPSTPFIFFAFLSYVDTQLMLIQPSFQSVSILYERGKDPKDKKFCEIISNPEKMVLRTKKYVKKHPEDKSGIITLTIARALNGEKITLTSDLLKIKEHNLTLLNFLLMNGLEEPVLEYQKTHPDYKNDYPLILSAVIGNSEKTFDLLIKKDWNTTDQNGLTWLDYAIIFNRDNLIEKYRNYALKLKDTKDKFGNTPIFYAIDCGKTDIAKWLIDNGISPLETNCYNKTLIQEGMIYGDIGFLSYLIEKGYKITQQDLDTTIYYQYSLLNFPELLKFYRKLGLKVKDKFIVLGYKFAESNNNKETTEKLKKEPAVRQYLMQKGKNEKKNE